MSSAPRDCAWSHDPRLGELRDFIERTLGGADFTIASASQDASFRRYFRVTRGESTWIAMDAPPDKENLEPYLRVAAILAEVGVNAPRVLAHDLGRGFLLNTDLGLRTYLMELEAGGDPDRLYEDAMKALVRMQSRGAEHARELPPYDEALLMREMALFTEWFCGRHLDLELDAEEQVAMNRAFDLLCAEALSQPRVFVHRDYHSRNLMVGDGGRYGENPGILDFQDAVYGPVTYDLVSLLRDCYVAWPPEQVRAWALRFRRAAAERGVDVGANDAQFLRWFDWMGVQRHLKAIGIFARLWRRDGKPGYLKDIPRTLDYVRAAAGAYSELEFLRAFIDRRVAPALAARGTS